VDFAVRKQGNVAKDAIGLVIWFQKIKTKELSLTMEGIE
jgi:hypothetical protein